MIFLTPGMKIYIHWRLPVVQFLEAGGARVHADDVGAHEAEWVQEIAVDEHSVHLEQIAIVKNIQLYGQ